MGEKLYNPGWTEESASAQSDMGSVEGMREGWLGNHRRELKHRAFFLRSVGSKPQAGLCSLQYQSPKSTQITSSCKKKKGFSLPEMDGTRYKGLFKGLMHKFSCAATYPRLRQRRGLEMLEVRLGTVAFGRKQREQPPGPWC